MYLLGHSEGTVTAMHVQIKRNDVAGIIQLCPTADSFDQVLIKQAEHIRDVTSGVLEGADLVATQKMLIERVKTGQAHPNEVEIHHIGLKWLREVLSINLKQALFPGHLPHAAHRG